MIYIYAHLYTHTCTIIRNMNAISKLMPLLGFSLLQQNTQIKKKVDEEIVNLSYTSLLFFDNGSLDRNFNKSRNLEAGDDACAMEGCCLQACSNDLVSLLSYRTQGHQSWDKTTHNGLGSSSSITNFKNNLTVVSMEAFSKFLFLYSDNSTLCTKLE